MYSDLGSKIDAQGKSMAGIVEMWDGAKNATLFFCRLARGWEWTVKQIFSKKFIALALGYIAIHYAVYHTLPDWTKWAVGAYKLYQGG